MRFRVWVLAARWISGLVTLLVPPPKSRRREATPFPRPCRRGQLFMRTEVHTHSKKALGTWKVSTSWASATTGFVALVAPPDIFVLAGFGGAAGGVVSTRGRRGEGASTCKARPQSAATAKNIYRFPGKG